MEMKVKKGVSAPACVWFGTNKHPDIDPGREKRWEEAQKYKDDDCVIM